MRVAILLIVLLMPVHAHALLTLDTDECRADFDRDGYVGIFDLNLLLLNLGSDVTEDCAASVRSPLCRADMDGDGVIGLTDHTLLLMRFATSGCYTPRVSSDPAIDPYTEIRTDSNGTMTFVFRDPPQLATTLGQCMDGTLNPSSPSACQSGSNAYVSAFCHHADPGSDLVSCVSDAECSSFGSWCSDEQWITIAPEEGMETGKLVTGEPALKLGPSNTFKILSTNPPVHECDPYTSADKVKEGGLPGPCRNGLDRDLWKSFGDGRIFGGWFFNEGSMATGVDHTVLGVASVVKAASLGDTSGCELYHGGAGKACLWNVAVLTVYNAAHFPGIPSLTYRPPPHENKKCFDPLVAGCSQTTWTVLDELGGHPNLDSTPGMMDSAPALASVGISMEGLQMGFLNRVTNASANCTWRLTQFSGGSCYHRNKASIYGSHALRTVVDCPSSDPQCFRLRNWRLQHGIDRMGATQTGWGGTCKREKSTDFPVLIAAQTFGEPEMARGFDNFRNDIYGGGLCFSGMDTFYESNHPVGTAGRYLWGHPDNLYPGNWASDHHGKNDGSSYFQNHVGQFLAWLTIAKVMGVGYCYGDICLTGAAHVVGRTFAGWHNDPGYDCGVFADPVLDTCSSDIGTPSQSCRNARNCPCNGPGPRPGTHHNSAYPGTLLPGECSEADLQRVPSVSNFPLAVFLRTQCFPGYLNGDGSTYTGTICAGL